MENAVPKLKQPNWVIIYNAIGVIVILVTGIFLYTVVQDRPSQPDGLELAIQQLSPVQAQERILQEGVILVDVRSSREWNNGQHIDGSISIPISQFSEANSVAISQMLPDKDAEIIVTCYSHNSRSMRAAEWLREHGYTNVQNLDGGLSAWMAQGLPTLPFVVLDDET